MAGSSIEDTSKLPQARGYVFVRVLGDRPIPVYAAHESTKQRKLDLVVIERLVRDKSIHDDDILELTRAARALASIKPLHIVPLRDVVIDSDAILLVNEFVDGESLASLWDRGGDQQLPMPMEVAIRVVLDVLKGLEELHQLKDSKGDPMGIVHGELSPGNVLVLTSGVARLRHACRSKWVALKVPTSVGFLAPELLLREGELDAQADVYSAGAILFQALAQVPPFPQGRASTIIRHLATSPIPSVRIPTNAPWAHPLKAIVTKAMALDRKDRYESARQMADAIRKAVKNHVATDNQVAGWVARMAGTRVLARRNQLASPGTPRTRSRRPPAPAAATNNAQTPPIPKAASSRDAKALAPATPAPSDPSNAAPMPIRNIGEPSPNKPKPTVPEIPPPIPGPPPNVVNLREHNSSPVSLNQPPNEEEIEVHFDSEPVAPLPPTSPSGSLPWKQPRLLFALGAVVVLLITGALVVILPKNEDSSANALPASQSALQVKTEEATPLSPESSAMKAGRGSGDPMVDASVDALEQESKDASIDVPEDALDPEIEEEEEQAPPKPVRRKPILPPPTTGTFDPTGI